MNSYLIVIDKSHLHSIFSCSYLPTDTHNDNETNIHNGKDERPNSQRAVEIEAVYEKYEIKAELEKDKSKDVSDKIRVNFVIYW